MKRESEAFSASGDVSDGARDDAPLARLENGDAPAAPKSADTGSPDAKAPDSDAGVNFYGQPPFKDIFFSTFFRRMLADAYSEDVDIYGRISGLCNQAISTAVRFIIYRKTVHIIAVAFIIMAAMENSPLPAPLDLFSVNLDMAALDSANFLISVIGVFAVSVGLIFWLGRDYDKSVNNIKGMLTNDVTGRCGNLFTNGTNCLDAIYTKQADRSIHDKAHQSEWPEQAKKQFLSGHQSAKRLQFLEFFTLIEVRRVRLRLHTYDWVSIAAYVLILAAAAVFALDMNDQFAVPLWQVLVAITAITGVWMFLGSRKNDDFSTDVLKSLVDEWHSFAKFDLVDRIGEIVRKDQVKIVELIGTMSRR